MPCRLPDSGVRADMPARCSTPQNVYACPNNHREAIPARVRPHHKKVEPKIIRYRDVTEGKRWKRQKTFGRRGAPERYLVDAVATNWNHR